MDRAGEPSWPGGGAYSTWHAARMRNIQRASLVTKVNKLLATSLVRLSITLGCVCAL